MINAEEFRPLPLHAPHAEAASAARAEADAVLADARAEAERVTATAVSAARRVRDAAIEDAERTAEEARGHRLRTLASVDAEANDIREAAKADVAKQEKNADLLDAWSMRVLMAATVGLTATGEYQLARMANFDPSVAWLFPLVIDVYVIQAFRRHRDVIQAITLTIAANVVYHLAASGLFGVTAGSAGHRQPTWWLIAGVASIASLILWRAHLINRPAKPPKPSRRKAEREGPETPFAAAAVADKKPLPEPTEPPRQEPPIVAVDSDRTTAKKDRQEDPPGAAKSRQEQPAKKSVPAAKKAAPGPRQKTAKKISARRSMTEWVTLTEPIFHAEFKTLKRNPTASEFADAISRGGHGRPSDSTAKNIRTEILDRTELPTFDSFEEQ